AQMCAGAVRVAHSPEVFRLVRQSHRLVVEVLHLAHRRTILARGAPNATRARPLSIRTRSVERARRQDRIASVTWPGRQSFYHCPPPPLIEEVAQKGGVLAHLLDGYAHPLRHDQPDFEGDLVAAEAVAGVLTEAGQEDHHIPDGPWPERHGYDPS